MNANIQACWSFMFMGAMALCDMSFIFTSCIIGTMGGLLYLSGEFLEG